MPPNHYSVSESFALAQDFDINCESENAIDLPFSVVAKNALKALSTSTRQCLLEREENLTYFNTYTKKHCTLECAWALAFKSCKCIPWFLTYAGFHGSICELYGQICFSKEVEKQQSVESDCSSKCLVNCQSSTYGKIPMSM